MSGPEAAARHTGTRQSRDTGSSRDVGAQAHWGCGAGTGTGDTGMWAQQGKQEQQQEGRSKEDGVGEARPLWFRAPAVGSIPQVLLWSLCRRN